MHRVRGRWRGGGHGAGQPRGAVVTRRLWCATATADHAREALDFPGPRAVPRVDCQTVSPDSATTTATRYFARSLDPADVGPGQLLAVDRGPWQGENRRHSEPDRWWDEDRHVGRRPGLAAGYPTVLSAALTALRATDCDEAEGSPRAAADALCWDLGRAINLVNDPAR